MNKSHLIKNKRGFTMVETLVAIAILMISIAGPLTIAQKGLAGAVYARDQVIASFLAQDIVEYVKNIRDYNTNINPNNWLDSIGSCTEASYCKIDTTGYNLNPPENCSGNSCLLYNDNNGYKTSGTEASKFSRYFYIIPNSLQPSEATLIAKVVWSNGTIQNSVTIENQIFNIIR